MKAKEFIIEQETGNVDDADSWQSQAADAARNAETVKMSQQDAAAGGVAEGTLNEASSDEAWELVGQPVPEIQQFVKQMGYGNDEQSVAKITPIIDSATATQIPAASIPKLKNLANKGNDVQTLKAIQQISGKPDAAQQYAKIMQARDAGEGRNRGYPVGDLIQAVKSGNYEAPVLLKLATGTYVIGGRTRLYAALALGIPAKVKIISMSTFAKQGQQELAEATQRLDPKCWTGYRKDGTKMKDGVRVNNCVKVSEDEYTYEGEISMLYEDEQLDEAEYQGRKVSLGKPMQGDVKKFKVYVKNPKGNVVKVNFGDPNMRIKKSNPARRKSFRARHNCANPGPRHKARYWSCRKW